MPILIEGVCLEGTPGGLSFGHSGWLRTGCAAYPYPCAFACCAYTHFSPFTDGHQGPHAGSYRCRYLQYWRHRGLRPEGSERHRYRGLA